MILMAAEVLLRRARPLDKMDLAVVSPRCGSGRQADGRRNATVAALVSRGSAGLAGPAGRDVPDSLIGDQL